MFRSNKTYPQKLLGEVNNLKKPFSFKIITVKELRKIVGDRPRKTKVVMCHGTFDIVHPGHIRQLIYAKSKGDILVVSITIDKYVTKRPISPYIPQELRALNIAAFEIVDYVIIDKNPSPINNIKLIKPDLFVKGFEYSSNKPSKYENDELDVIKSYGGKLIFSPGDIVYSSSDLLTTRKPNLSHEQLLTLMTAEKIDFNKLRKTISGFKNINVHVIGDMIIDKISYCTILGPASSSTAFSVRLDKIETFIGAAGVVAKHLKNLGANVILTSVVGKDIEAKKAYLDLRKAGIKLNLIEDDTRPTTIKNRFHTSNNQKLLQVDTVDNSSISNSILKKICSSVEKTSVHAIICCDFRHGIFNRETIKQIKKSIPSKVLKIADSQVSNRWGNILDFKDFDLITPNEQEARFALADQDTTIRPLAEKLYKDACCKYLILKLGENGLLTYRKRGSELRKYFYIDTFVDKLVDSVGAGDALLAAATLTLAASGDIVQSAIIGNISAAIECSKFGNYPTTTNELLKAIEKLENRYAKND